MAPGSISPTERPPAPTTTEVAGTGWATGPARPAEPVHTFVWIAGLTLLAGLVLTVWFALGRPSPIRADAIEGPSRPGGIGSDPTRPNIAGRAPAAEVSVSASCISPASKDAAGVPVTYEPGNLVDGRLDTAWRCDGDGVGQALVIDLGTGRDISSIEMVPGYAKVDPLDGTDRYAQNRRISAARFTFDDGTSTVQNFDTSPYTKTAQRLSFRAVRTRTVRMTILGTTPGEQVGTQPPMDKTTISEISIGSR